MLYTFVICFIAGIGAGLGTGFAGMSAAAVISPMLITFLHMEPYMAVGIALASDVLHTAFCCHHRTYDEFNSKQQCHKGGESAHCCSRNQTRYIAAWN